METWVRKIDKLYSNYQGAIPFGSTLNLSLFIKEISLIIWT